MFLQLHPAPVLIDEVQYAPELFSQIKMAADARREPGAIVCMAGEAGAVSSDALVLPAWAI